MFLYFSFFYSIIRYRIFILFLEIMKIRSTIRFKRVPESPWRSYDYIGRIYVPRYLIAVFSKSANYKIYSHFCLIFVQFLFYFLSFFSFFFLLIFYFYLFFFGISSIFHKFYTHNV